MVAVPSIPVKCVSFGIIESEGTCVLCLWAMDSAITS